MYLTPEQLAQSNKAGIEAAIGFAQIQFAAFERLSALHFSAARAAFDSFTHFAAQACELAGTGLGAATRADESPKGAEAGGAIEETRNVKDNRKKAA